ncbi:MAG: ExeM/NucH family extracellular endonuclease [Xanthomonadales bacterium]|nr:ExeM/NucH family extracellular endonuclease [Xanthomonadales bacterium]
MALLVLAALAGCSRDRDTAPLPAPPREVRFACGEPATAIAGLPRTRGQGIAQLGRVELEAVVVADFRDGLGGFVLQSAAGDDDGDATTPEGVFVAHDPGRGPVRIGQRLRVRGLWARSDDPAESEWALRDVTDLLDCGPGELPAALELAEPPADWAALSGMRVRLPGPLVISGNDGLLRFGELLLAFEGRLYAPTELAAPGRAARRQEQRNRRRSLVLDDARLDPWPRALAHLPAPPSARSPYRVGSTVEGIEGVIERRHRAWRLQPTGPVARVNQAPRPQAPARSDGAVRVAGFNVLNFFNGDGRGAGYPTARGAATPGQQRQQRDKLVAALRALDADIVAVMEVENDGGGADSALVELAGALAQGRGSGDWQGLDHGRPRLGSDEIAVGLLYRADRVRPLGDAHALEEPPFDRGSRVPLAQAFVAGDDGVPFTVVVNHFKSKGGCDRAEDADVDQGDGQACFNALRVASARRLADWLATDPAGTGAGQVLVIGDLNAHGREAPLRVLTSAGWTDLLTGRDPPAWTYVFRGQSGRLDHALAGGDLAARVRAAGTWAANADELPGFEYAAETGGRRLYAADPWRSSDHDPVWVDLTP